MFSGDDEDEIKPLDGIIISLRCRVFEHEYGNDAYGSNVDAWVGK